MLAPKTYTGYDQEGNVVCRCTAIDANEYLNPNDVKNAIDNIESVATEGINNICKALNNVAPDADEAVIVQGTKVTGTIEEVCSAIKSLPSSITDNISSMYTEAIAAHDNLQTQANDGAYNQVRNTADVVSVR